MNKKIILASKSPQRYKILKSLGVKFEVVAPLFAEKILENIKYPSVIVKRFAEQKATEIKLKLLEKKQKRIIVAADTIVFYKGKIIGKPQSYNEAENILIELSNTSHAVYTGFCVIDLYQNKIVSGYEKTKISMRQIPSRFFKKIIKRHIDKAGCYAIQDKFNFIKSINGDFYNVVGLPKKKIAEILTTLNVKIDESLKNDKEKNEFFMRQVLALAKKGANKTHPNPLVGAIILDENCVIIGKGYHKKYGGSHAEIEALNSVKQKDKKKLKDATIFINLEPCCHFGKTPPCTEALLNSGIKKVVVATLDPNRKVNTKGIEILKKNNIEVLKGVLEKEAKKLNSKFFELHK